MSDAPMLPPTDDQADAALEQRAAVEREAIVDQELDLQWRGTALRPWSQERARLLDALCAADVPAPDLDSCDDETFFHGAFPRAVKVLYLMHHVPEDWQPLRSRLLAVIDAWGLEHVPGDTIEQKAAAVLFTGRVERAHRKLIAVPRPTSQRGGRAGN